MSQIVSGALENPTVLSENGYKQRLIIYSLFFFFYILTMLKKILIPILYNLTCKWVFFRIALLLVYLNDSGATAFCTL